MKDIFVDTSSAQNLSNPKSQGYKDLLEWLKKDGHLVYSDGLLREIGQGNQVLLTLINKLIADGRSNKIKNNQLNNLTIKKSIERNFISNWKDRIHIKTVILSNRKLAIALDNNLRRDINLYPKVDGVKPVAVDCPTKCCYK